MGELGQGCIHTGDLPCLGQGSGWAATPNTRKISIYFKGVQATFSLLALWLLIYSTVLNSATIDIWSHLILCHGDCSVHFGLFHSILRLCPPDASKKPPPPQVLTTKNTSSLYQMSLEKTCFVLRSTNVYQMGFTQSFHHWVQFPTSPLYSRLCPPSTTLHKVSAPSEAGPPLRLHAPASPTQRLFF